MSLSLFFFFFFFKQKTAYEMRISDWSSDVCSSDLSRVEFDAVAAAAQLDRAIRHGHEAAERIEHQFAGHRVLLDRAFNDVELQRAQVHFLALGYLHTVERRSEEHTSELQSLMRISYAVFCLKKQKTYKTSLTNISTT